MEFEKVSEYLKILFVTFFLALIVQSCTEAELSPVNTVDEAPYYVGSESCKECHAPEFEKWQTSHHFHAMEIPTETSVLADFDSSTFSANGMDYHFFRQGNDFLVAILEEGVHDTFRLKYTFGYTPLQQYLIETEKGKVQTLRASWDTEKKLWFHQYADQDFDKNDWFHFTNQSANWNGMCAHCHSTDVNKGFNTQSESYNTTFEEINVSCESCHGKGSKHIELAELEENYSNENSGFTKMQPSNTEFVNMCGGCHARRGQLYDQVQPREEFHDAFNLSWLSEDNYHIDGQIKGEDYVLGSFLSSKMFSRNVMCSSCHDSHSMELKFEGNKLCMQCHESKYDSKEHHFHDENDAGASCIDCHMTGAFYMGNDFRRDHSFRIPRPDQSVKYNTPNACTGCHKEKSNAWAAEAIVDWYGSKRPEHFSDNLLKGWIDGDYSALVELAANDSAPAIARGTAIHYLALANPRAVAENANAWMNSKELLVRKAAQQAIHEFPLEQRLLYAVPALKDPSKSVRIEAAINLMDANENDIPPAYKNAFYDANEEHETFLEYSADFPEGQAQIAQYHYVKGNYDAAIIAYRKALKIDSLRTEPRMNLAITYNLTGQNEQSLKQLNRLETIQPSAHVYYLRGLLLAEMNRFADALEDLNTAIELNPNNATYRYNLILVLNQTGKTQLALSQLQVALAQFPQDERLRSLVNLFR